MKRVAEVMADIARRNASASTEHTWRTVYKRINDYASGPLFDEFNQAAIAARYNVDSIDAELVLEAVVNDLHRDSMASYNSFHELSDSYELLSSEPGISFNDAVLKVVDTL